MIQPLRAVHRRAFVALALVLPAILLIGLGARRPRPGPSAHATEVPATAYLVRESSGLWQKHAIQSKFYSKSDRPQDIYVVLQPARELNEPDLLLYWAANAPQGRSLPTEAQLVGSFTAGKAFVLPLSVARAGHLILFSLPHQTVFDTARVEKLP
jgi:sirohydrochlorin ferrochelatase